MTDETLVKLKSGQKLALSATIVTFLLALGKGIVGLLSGSVALITDAVHSAADIFTIFGAWIGLKIAGRKPTEKFPYGYYKAENLATLFISVIILYLGFELLLSGYYQLFAVPDLSFTYVALAVPLLSSVISFIISIYEKRKGEEINSQALIANGEESFMDTLSSLIVFIAIVATYFNIPYADGAVGIIIALLIFKIGIFNIKDSLLALMDVSPKKDVEKQIGKILKSTKGLEDFSDLKLRKSGPFVMGEVKAKVKKTADVNRAHEVSDNIERKIKDRVKGVDSFTVHVEPYKENKYRICIPIKKENGLDSRVMYHFGRAEKFLFVDVEKGNVKKKYVKENPFKNKKVRAGLKASHFIVDEDTDVLITKEIGEISFHTLRDHMVDIYKGNKAKTAKKIIEHFCEDKLTRLTEPTKSSDKE